MSSLIEVVVLDLAGVVCGFAPERRLQVFAELTGLTTDAVDAAVWGSGLDERAELGKLSPDESYDAVEAALERTVGRDQLRRAWATAFTPDHELLALVRRVRRPTALFANSGPVIEDCFGHELSSVTTAFDRVLLSWRLEAVKPDPDAFVRATGALGLTPSSVLYVDATLASVRSASQAGWIAHRFRGVDRLRDLFDAHGLLVPQ